MNEKIFDYLILRASPDPIRFESLNAGVVVFDGQNTAVLVDASKRRLPALHPDLGRIDFTEWAEKIQDELRRHPQEMQMTILQILSSPLTCDRNIGKTTGEDALQQAEYLFKRLVERQSATLSLPKNRIIKQSKLAKELKNWFKSSKVFSNKIEGLSRHLVVENYPVDPASDLYADFALQNGKLHVIETLDLRNIDHLTPSMRGNAAIKGFTLNEVGENSNAIAIISASDYSVARPAIAMISKFADDVYDVSTLDGRQNLSQFIAESLHKPDLNLNLHIN
jgi:Protein of unknown function (DUF3037)